jgi:hypothetical protein
MRRPGHKPGQKGESKMLHLYEVGLKDRETGEKINLKVKAHNTNEATHKICDALLGHNGPYVWTGTGPIYKNNKLIDIAE